MNVTGMKLPFGRRASYTYAMPRFEQCPGPEARQYLIREHTRLIAAFITDQAPDGRSGHEVAIGNLIGYSKDLAGTYVVTWLPADGDPVDLAFAEDGVGTLLQDQDAISADSWFGRMLTPAARARAAWNVRHGFDAPTMWGEDAVAS